MVTNSSEKSARYRAKDIDAYRKRKREYAKTPEQKEKRRVYMKKWVAENRVKANECARKSHAKSRKNRTPEQRHAQHLKATYNITREEYLEKLTRQGNRCLICGIDNPRGNKSWHVDHCHKTEKLRGLLCNMCNPRLGWYETYRETINNYLETATW